MYEYCESSVQRTPQSKFPGSFETVTKSSHETQEEKNSKKTL